MTVNLVAWTAIGAIALAAVPATLWGATPHRLVPPRVERALVAGHLAAFGKPPPPLRLRIAMVNVALETAHGTRMCPGNVGGIGARPREPACWSHGHRVRRFRSLEEGARAYWRLPAVRAALPFFDAGDARGAAVALKAAGYYQAPLGKYVEGMVALAREIAP